MTFSLTVDTENDAFNPDPSSELVAVLRKVENKVAREDQFGIVNDTNGNVVGWFSLDGRCGFSNWGFRCTKRPGHKGDHDRGD